MYSTKGQSTKINANISYLKFRVLILRHELMIIVGLLSGSGKPLKSSSDHNPYVDSHSYRLNSVLINNGYAPQWMTLESEIK